MEIEAAKASMESATKRIIAKIMRALTKLPIGISHVPQPVPPAIVKFTVTVFVAFAASVMGLPLYETAESRIHTLVGVLFDPSEVEPADVEPDELMVQSASSALVGLV